MYDSVNEIVRDDQPGKATSAIIKDFDDVSLRQAALEALIGGRSRAGQPSMNNHCRRTIRWKPITGSARPHRHQ
ncbi:MAG: hypothetical protein BGP06_03550 [Rhizobiales bacterium 65-9]|nr:MAG: hypothetical protein BGP06_03550 [Rhizobiales bacterium 65-9]